MDENEAANLDLEFKRYLQLLRPYLGQLVDDEVIKICDAWIQRLSDCKDNEKSLRNKYIFSLCYQLARGVLDRPFLNTPPTKLQPLSDDTNSDDSSTEVEYLVINSDEDRTKILYNNKNITVSDTEYMSQGTKFSESVIDNDISRSKEGEHSGNPKVYYYHCPDIFQNVYKPHPEEYESRANNLVRKLREIKMQNLLLHNELMALKEESKSAHDDMNRCCIARIDHATSPIVRSNDSNVALNSLKTQLQDIKDSRNLLIETIANLQDQLDNFTELKKNQIDDIEAKHKLELIKVRTDAREETKSQCEKKFEELKQSYDETIAKIRDTAESKINSLSKTNDEVICEKNKLIEAKNNEIQGLKNQLESQKTNLQSIVTKFMEKSAEDVSVEGLKLKNELLEKRLYKVEKAKIKCARLYEAKLTQVQRDKHLAECSLQLQMVKQRAQVVSELTDENQTELSMSLDKLESKYKEIVANVQSTAIKRRLEDQKALEAILQAVCGIDEQNPSHYSNPARNTNQTFDTENTSLLRANKVGNIGLANTSYGEDSILAGFCLNGEKMGKLFERVYIPQKDGETK